MKIRAIYLFLGLVYIINVFGQSNELRILPFKKYEIQLLNLITKDSTSELTLELDSKLFNFGMGQHNQYTNLHLIKHGKKILIQPLGSGRLFQILNEHHSYQMIRLDDTYHTGSNFFCYNFFSRDTLFQFGGLGFWNMRGYFTFFSNQTNQWEMYQSNRQVINYFSIDRPEIVKYFNRDEKQPKFYTTNSLYFTNFPFNFDVNSTDSTYVFDFNKKEWAILGKNSLDFKKFTRNSNQLVLRHKKYLVLQNTLDFFWFDFEQNQFGRLYGQKIIFLRQRWLNLYNKESKESKYNFQFSLNDNEAYFCKIDMNDNLVYHQININTNDFDFSTAKPIYLPNNSVFEKYSALVYKLIWPFILIATLLIGYFIYFYNHTKKRNIPKKVNEILNTNFFTSLTIVEKELLEILLNHAKQQIFVTAKQINKIIGVQQKDVITQNKSRSDYFIKINQKYKLATQQEESLIIKERDKDDKRQYNYSIHPKYIKNIESLFNT